MLIEITELCKIYQPRPRSDILKLETPIKMLYARMPQKEMLMDTSLLLRRWNDFVIKQAEQSAPKSLMYSASSFSTTGCVLMACVNK
jgi:hypothetical protein